MDQSKPPEDQAPDTETTRVNGGWVKRVARSGRVLAVGSASGISRASPKSLAAVDDASARRSAALQRLADR